MLTLCLLRHAKSSWDNPALDDVDRGLSSRGIKAAPEIGRALRHAEFVPDLILCSSSVRTRATLMLILPELRLSSPSILYEDELYLAPSRRILDRIQRIDEPAQSVLMVGHNPSTHQLALELTGKGKKSFMAELASKFPTAAYAILRFDAAQWSDVQAGAGELIDFVTPKGLKD
jgi:phosphohistidine phosphatase